MIIYVVTDTAEQYHKNGVWLKVQQVLEEQSGGARPEPAGDLYRPAAGLQQNGVGQFVAVTGVLWQYVGISPMPAPGGQCVCTGARFDLDEFGRSFVPDKMGYAVNVLDPDGNLLARFGAYGNMDSRGPGSPVPAPPIAFASPLYLAASARACYVSDGANNRIVRVRLDYAATATVPVKS